MSNKKVLFIISHSVVTGPSQRYRVGLFLPLLQQNNIAYTIRSFYNTEGGKILYSNGKYFRKIAIVLKGFIKRAFTTFFEAWKYDYVFIQRGATPFGPPIFEWIMAKIFRKKIIFDFDDAIWIPDPGQKSQLHKWLKATWKVKYICKWSYKVVGGNDYLCAFAKKYNNNVIKIPTCVDVDKQHNQVKKIVEYSKLTVGWTGSHTTLKYLDSFVPVINRLQHEFDFTFLVICNKTPVWDVKDWEFIQWNGKTEVEDLLHMDIGVMPLTEDAWSEGKCGFKLIQYLSLGIPAVASPVGVNKQIIKNKVEGILCNDENEWISALRQLLSDSALRQQMGIAGRDKIESQFSIKSQADKFINLFN